MWHGRELNDCVSNYPNHPTTPHPHSSTPTPTPTPIPIPIPTHPPTPPPHPPPPIPSPLISPLYHAAMTSVGRPTSSLAVFSMVNRCITDLYCCTMVAGCTTSHIIRPLKCAVRSCGLVRPIRIYASFVVSIYQQDRHERKINSFWKSIAIVNSVSETSHSSKVLMYSSPISIWSYHN